MITCGYPAGIVSFTAAPASLSAQGTVTLSWSVSGASLRISERRNHLDLQINLLSEQENTKMLKMLEQISKKLGIDSSKPVPWKI